MPTATATNLVGKQAALTARLHSFGTVLVAFSGGVDSAYLVVAALDALGRDNVLAVLGVSASIAHGVHERARRLAADFGVPFREVATHELDDADYVANRGDRCFHCKLELWNRLVPYAREAGLAAIADGTILDDLGEHRPGKAAGTRAGVVSPLAECGFTKRDVREAARRGEFPAGMRPRRPALHRDSRLASR